jgi:tRNA (guanine10-N2)-methyltransferase
VDGRLAFWMPSANEDDEVLAIPRHGELELMECCVQRFYKWSRRLLVYRRRRGAEGGEVTGRGREDREAEGIASGKTASDLNPFRRKYFQGFQT